jgi:hypothetical protein
MNRREFFKQTAVAGTVAGLSPATFARRVYAAPSDSSFKAGYFETDITPAVGMEQPGGYGKSYHQSLHDPCKVRAAVFDDGNRRVALVGIDALTCPRSLAVNARAAIQERCGITPEAVLIGASHSHSSGPVAMVQPGQYDHASDFVQELAYEKSSCANADYLAHVERQIVTAVCQADSRRTASVTGVGSGHEEEAAYNRRFLMENGLTYTHPGQMNPDIVEVAGPIDPEVGVIGSWDSDGNLLGCIVTYACHATTNPGGISANWIYYMEQIIQGAVGAEVPVVFLAAPSADVTQVDNQSPYQNPSGEEWAQFVGGRVGAEAVKTLLTMEPGDLTPLDARVEMMNFGRRVPEPERVERSYELVRKDPEAVGSARWTFAKEIVLLDALLEKAPSVDVEIQAVQVGPAVFPTTPAEYFCQLGLDIKEGSNFPFTFPVSLANGSVGYVPTEEAFGEYGGGYETRLTSYSNLEITAGREMADKGLELAGQLSPGDVPVPPEAEVDTTPWAYGSVPPERGLRELFIKLRVVLLFTVPPKLF